MRRVLLLLCVVAWAQQGPVNLDFEQGQPGQVPPGWSAPVRGFAAVLARADCHSGEGCAVVSYAGGDISQSFGNLMQMVDAIPYRGKRIRFGAWVRAEVRAEFDRGQLWFRVDRANGQMGFFDNMQDRPIRSPQWRHYEISGDIAADARALAFGIMSFAHARVWIDGVTLDAIPVTDTGPEVAAAREQIQRSYRRMDAAFESGDVDVIASLALPDAVVGSPTRKMPIAAMLAEARETLRRTGKIASTSQVTALRLSGAEAVVSAETEQRFTQSGVLQTYVHTSRAIWERRPEGWRPKESTPLSVRAVAPPTDPETVKRVGAEIRQRATPLATVNAGQPESDLKAFGAAVGDARVVALGEATHGTSEFFRLKHRLLEYLVKKKGFTVFSIEANWPEALAVDRYIQSGQGDPKKAIAGMYFWTWNTQEVLEMVEWMRTYNASAPPGRKLTFTSFDMQTPNVAAQEVTEYLRRVSPGDVAAAKRAARSVADAASLVQLLDSRREALVRTSTPTQFRDARQAAEIVRQALTLRGSTSAGFRDEMMARNTEWLLSQVHPGEKMVIWAHNGHVSLAESFGVKSMGGWLRERLGRELYVAGFAFRGGALRAIGTEEGRYTALENQSAPPAPEGSGDAVLSEARMPLFFLDLRSVPPSTDLGRWLLQPHLFYQVGAMWARDEVASNRQMATLSSAYDGLIFVEFTHAALGLPMAR